MVSIPGARTAPGLRLAAARRRIAWTFLAPAMLVLGVVAVWPLARTIWFSLTDARLSDPQAGQFVGLDNFADLIAAPEWWRAVGNTLAFAAISVACETALGMVIALALHQPFAGRGLVRAAILVPWAVPTVVSAKLWAWMLNDVFGVVNELLLSAGAIASPIAWIASPRTALLSVVVVDVWKTTPFMTLLLLAGLQTIPDELYEAARIDGARPVQAFLRITLPLLRPALLVALIFRTLDALRVFDIIYVMTGNSLSTMSMSVFARQQLVDFQDFGFGSAAATLLFAVIALVTLVYVRLGGLGEQQ